MAKFESKQQNTKTRATLFDFEFQLILRLGRFSEFSTSALWKEAI